jgi:hypothetical protein
MERSKAGISLRGFLSISNPRFGVNPLWFGYANLWMIPTHRAGNQLVGLYHHQRN